MIGTGGQTMIRRRGVHGVSGHWLVVVITVGVLMLASDLRVMPAPATSAAIDGPYSFLLGASTDLGPAHSGTVQLTASLHDPSRPDALIAWAGRHGLSVRWRPGDPWAIIEGEPV